MPVFSHAFAAATVVEAIPATPEDEHAWIRVRMGGAEILRCRPADASKATIWKDALTAAMVLTALLGSMKATKESANAGGSSGMTATAIILKSVYMLKVNSACLYAPNLP